MTLVAGSFRADAYAVAARHIRPKDNLTVSEWADAHRMLVEGADAEPGPWRTSRNPLTREIMDMLSESSPVRKVVFEGPTQFAKTAISTNWLGYIISHAKGSVGLFMPTENTLADWSAQKFAPLVEGTACVREALAKKSSGDNNARRKGYVGGSLYFRTAGSTADLKNISLRYAIADEVDEYERDTGQGDVIGLIEARQSTYQDSKLYVCSAPTLKGHSIIEEEFGGGDQRYAHLPCPHCGEYQALKWGNLMWSKTDGVDKRIRHIWYTCEHNGCEILEHHKPDMMARHRWIAKNPGAPYPSFHASALYSPIGLGRSWRDLAEEWLEAQGDTARMMRFINTRLAESYADRTSDIKSNVLMSRAEPYGLRAVPRGCLLVTVGVDVQSGHNARLEIQVLGHGRGDVTWTLDYHVLHGSPTEEKLWHALAEYVNGIQLTNDFGVVLRAEACAIDTGGHNAHDVYNFVRANRVRRPMAIKGANKPGQAILGKPRRQDVNWRGITTKNGVSLYMVGSDTAKHLLYGRLHADADKPASERKARFSQDLDEKYFNGLVSETFNPRKNRWEIKKGHANEPLDTWNYALAAAHHPEIYLHKWKKSDWDRRSAMVEPVDVAAVKVEENPSPLIVPPTTTRKGARRRGSNFATRW